MGRSRFPNSRTLAEVGHERSYLQTRTTGLLVWFTWGAIVSVVVYERITFEWMLTGTTGFLPLLPTGIFRFSVVVYE